MTPRISVLIVEDDVLLGTLLKRVFRAFGCVPHLLSDARQVAAEL